MADITSQEQQRAAADAAQQRIRAALLQESDQTPEQDDKPIRVREAEIMHFDHLRNGSALLPKCAGCSQTKADCCTRENSRLKEVYDHTVGTLLLLSVHQVTPVLIDFAGCGACSRTRQNSLGQRWKALCSCRLRSAPEQHVLYPCYLHFRRKIS